MNNPYWDYVYCYPNSDVLENKLNIREQDELFEVEREITGNRIFELQDKPIKGDFDLKHLQDIHRFIFSDLYSWAGELRVVNISKGEMFHRFDYVESAANSLFDKLKKENFLMGLSTEDICKRLAYYLGEINVIHPFREGNGRTQRVFIEYLAKSAGYDVNFSDVTQDEMIEASIQAFDCEYETMEQMFARITKPISFLEQEKFIKAISTSNSSVLKAYHDNSCCFIEVNEQQLEKLKHSGIQFQCVKKYGLIAVKYSIRDNKKIQSILQDTPNQSKKMKR